jgi:hypothetical protein
LQLQSVNNNSILGIKFSVSPLSAALAIQEVPLKEEHTMGLTSVMEQTIVSGSAAARTSNKQADDVHKSSASPEEGRRLMQAFLHIQREDLREEVLKFVSELLRIQEER